MSASNPASPDPTHIGKFEIVKKLGAGAFGTVYKARDPELGREVAIKTIRLEGLAASQASLDDLLARFKREAKVAAGLRHPNIVTIHEIGSLPGNSYLVMEFVDGPGLDRVIATAGKMSTERAAAIGAQVANALAFAHRHKVVHRDIKPANIMIEPGDHVKVTDFGIAKFTDSQADNLTATGSLLGTPSYMSPEQARGTQVDGRSDIFSLGCVLYEMVAGQKAFRGDSITALLFKIITEEPPSLREIDPTVSDELLRVIARALSKAPETRYQTAQDLADELLNLTRPGFVPTLRSAEVPTLPPDAPPADVPTVASPPTVRPDPTVASAGAVPPPLPPTVLTPGTVREPARPPAPPAARPTPSARPAPAAARRTGSGTGLLVGLALAAVLGLAVVVGGGYLLLRKPATVEPSPVAEAPAVEPSTPAESPAEARFADATPEATATHTATPAPDEPRATPAPRAVATTTPTPPPAPRPAEPEAPPPADDYAFLDEPPSDTPDGRAAGEALARLYSGRGSSGGYTASRYPRRPKVPRDLAPAERPAAATLLFVHMAQEAFHASNSRYGTLKELADAGVFRLDRPFDANGFRRAGRRTGGRTGEYDFRLTVGSDGYTMTATPQGPFGRPLLVDDSGFVRFPD